MRHGFTGLLTLCVALLTACDRTPEVPVQGGDPCKSLEPMLDALPSDEKIGGVPAVYRGCDSKNGNVAVVYAAPEGTPSYAFNVTVLNGESPYVESFRNLPENMSGGSDVFALQTQLRRQKYQNQIKDCRAAIASKADDIKKPMIFTIGGLTTCMYGLITPGGRKLQAFAVDGDFGYELIIGSADAAKATGLVEALNEVRPLFEKFNPSALR